MVSLVNDEDGKPHWMLCTRCGVEVAFDQTLPYVNQTVAFDRDHDCSEIERHDR